MAEKASSNVTRKRVRILAALTLSVVCLACMILQAPFFVPKLLAEALIPPLYPGSAPIAQWSTGTGCCLGEVRTYRAPDSVEQVLAFAERYNPGFQMEQDLAHGVIYRNGAADHSWLSAQMSWLAFDEVSPWMFITLYADPDRPATTVIIVEVNYPAP